MKERKRARVKTIATRDPKSFDKLYDSTADRLVEYNPEIESFTLGDMFCARFSYQEVDSIPETIEDEFMQNNVRCTCSDCPFLMVGTDARRKTFPCKYAPYGESRIDSPACAVFYREAVRLMREKAER